MGFAVKKVERYTLSADVRYPTPDVLDAGDTLTLRVAPKFSLTLANLFNISRPLGSLAFTVIPSLLRLTQ